jgi:transposase
MIIQSKYNKQFVSNSLTSSKYNELYEQALYLRNFRNELSKEVNSNLLFYLDMNKFNFIKYVRNNFHIKINSSFDARTIISVFTTYQNKFKTIIQKLTFEKITYLGVEYYKRDSKDNKKGDFKIVNIKREKTPLSITLTYLARYGNNNIVSYINEQCKTCDENKLKFYKNILFHIEKFGLFRLLLLSLQRKNRIIKHYSKYPIEFKSLTFGGRSRKKIIVSYNKNYNSVINSFITLTWNNKKKIDIPIKFSKMYHGNMKDYFKPDHNYEYIITFNEKKKQVSIHICKDGKRYIPEVTKGDKLVGIDVNIKHNLFCLSNGETYDYDRKLVLDYCKLCNTLDKQKIVGKKKQYKLDVLRNKIKKKNQTLISTICNNLQKDGVKHIVMENLNNGFGKSFIKDKNNDNLNFNRIVSFLNISSLKDEFEHIGRNYDIGVSTVHSYYTSKQCPICGCIDDENRLSQEEFICVQCGHRDNADHNASINIKNRVDKAVLCQSLLKQLDNGTFEPKIFKKRNKVKEILLSFRGSEVYSHSEVFYKT